MHFSIDDLLLTGDGAVRSSLTGIAGGPAGPSLRRRCGSYQPNLKAKPIAWVLRDLG